LAAGTVDLELMAYLMCCMHRGASVITCAGPGGTGKTTLLGALLCFLPGDVELKVVHGRESYRETGVCYLCHELGHGWFSYLWGAEARALLEVAQAKDRRYCATTAHADELDELRQLLTESDIVLSDRAFAHIDLVIFMRRFASLGRALRRVTDVYRGTGDAGQSHEHVSRWDRRSDTFVWRRSDGDGWHTTAPMHDELEEYRAFLGFLLRERMVHVADVRKAVLDFYTRMK
jgi:hypothetical protein